MNSVTKLLLARARTVRPDGDVPSPCMSVCRMNAATGWCEGCLRTLDEIAAWSTLDDEGKRCVWRSIEQRAAA
ncbi:MAG TPA: DUF1289 domain-containing protein [Ramlibacter sp.]|uniref:DUF1289 domain-containing protein n=1 Tax=Ramlibacter sp. TaxID=1917967 RepID=UPI002CFC5F16|nr:DUF1289 domain-containing protein [Ramlibacter sp.]HVZ44016.1 DUF1289 domain-containing protein [Ramlibacter sp.]